MKNKLTLLNTVRFPIKHLWIITKISKKRVDSHYNIQSKIGYDEIKPTKLVACEGLEGSKHAYNDHKQQKATENSNYKKEKINQRRERDLNLWF